MGRWTKKGKPVVWICTCSLLCSVPRIPTQAVQKSTSRGSRNTGLVRSINEAWLDYIEIDSRNYGGCSKILGISDSSNQILFCVYLLLSPIRTWRLFFFFLERAFKVSRFPFLDRWKYPPREKNYSQKPHPSHEKTRVEISSGARQDSIFGGSNALTRWSREQTGRRLNCQDKQLEQETTLFLSFEVAPLATGATLCL